jgi:mRNA interferase RelE/StbE
MRQYAIEFAASADKALQKLPLNVQRRIVAAIEKLSANPRPRGAVKLVGDQFAWRIRVGEYRVVYDIYDARLVILVVRIGHRKDVYRD